ncbi:hypothetical protein CVIRNUC_010222 [Coccomyxa viridis]|uniref:Uncharacterized protein n=1 Tax=Coccomyxa viridis TaxID=1274662 RepID=A0AAV1II45_9CHLO|nr:hypothetical protein CVIRNUC_010222 [Coccomyxa viridis]
MVLAAKEPLAKGRCGHLRPFLPARPAIRQAARSAVRCAASGENGRKAEAMASVDRRAALLGLLGLGLAADAQAASNPLAQKKDPYTELQSIVKGRGGPTSLLDSLKPGKVNDTVQKGIIAPLTSSPQSKAFSKAPAVAKPGGGPSIELVGGLAALGVVGAISVSQSGAGGGKAPKKAPVGTQRIGASAKQAVKKVQKAAPKPIGGSTKFPSPPKPKAAGLPGTGLFGTQRISPGTAKKAVDKAVTRAVPRQAPQKAKQIPQKAKQLPQKAKQLPQKAKQVSRQAGRAAQQAAPGGFKDALKNQDTLANVGGAVLVGLGVLVASSATLGSAQQVAKPVVRAAQQVKSGVKEAAKDVKQAVKGAPQAAARAAPKDVPKEAKAAVKEAPNLASKVSPPQAPSLPKLPSTPSPPSLPRPPALPTPPSVPSTPPPVQAEKPKVPSGPDLIPEAVKKPQTPQGPPPPAFPKPTTPSGPNTFKLPSSSIQDKKPAAPSRGPTASVAQAPTSGAPNSNIAGGVVALAAVGLAAAAATNSQQQGTGSDGMPEASSPTPSPGGTGTSEDNTPEGIKKRKEEAKKWIEEWRASQK